MNEQKKLEKGFHVSWDQFHQDSRALAWRLQEVRRKNPRYGPWQAIIAVTRGGLHPAGIVARELNLRIIETVGVALYDYKIRGSDVEILKPIGKEFLDKYGDENGRHILVIDDLVDTGKTARVIKSMLPSDIHYATLYSKPSGEIEVNTKITQVSQDTWVYFPWDMGMKFQPPLIVAQDEAAVVGVEVAGQGGVDG